MKTLKKTVLVALLLFSTLFVQAQDEKKVQAYWIHEDRVKPSMVEEYEQVTRQWILVKCLLGQSHQTIKARLHVGRCRTNKDP